jgi:pimeloyl-ACP methyl ester carboxylesterase
MTGASCAHALARALALCIAFACSAAQAQESRTGTLPSGATYRFDLPAQWNGTVLLFSHGYAPGPANPARTAPRDEAPLLLARGYALIGSSYSKTGWALAEAVPDQLATLDLFAAQAGKPRRVLAWGSSMGGLATIALMERHPQRFDGGMALCASASGTLGMMNTALDGAFVFKTLLAPDSNLQLRFMAAAPTARKEWQQALDAAQATEAGRARIALAATLAQTQTWVDGPQPPSADDARAVQLQLYKAFLPGVLLPRDDQELRAGGNFSWNTGVDYSAALAATGREAFVRSLYARAGLDLQADLRKLAQAPRVPADPQAVAAMKAHYVPTGELRAPLLALQTVSDPYTLTEFTGDYARLAPLARGVYVQRAGHCNFTPAETLTALQALEERISKGSWNTAASTLNRQAQALDAGPAAFTEHSPAPLLRSCNAKPGGCPMPGSEKAAVARPWWSPGDGQVWPGSYPIANATGLVTTLNSQGTQPTKGHPFFTALGSNGRACVSCHQPSDGMSLSVQTVRERWQATKGKDPIFAAIDGSNCPTMPQGVEASHSLLLNRGLFRVVRPWPPVAHDGKAINPEFTLEVVRDPTGCNNDKNWGLNSAQPAVSVYRRPRAATNIKYLTAIGFDFEPKNGLPMLLDPETGKPTSGNLMADARALTLRAQALDAMRWHLEFKGQPDAALVQRIVDFESQLSTAQSFDQRAGALDADGAQGGPAFLQRAQAGALQSTNSNPSWAEEFKAWAKAPGADETQRAFRASVLRGVEVYSRRTFLITDSAGLTNIPLGNPVRDGCSLCHNMLRSGMDVAPGQIDLGTTNMPHADASPELPLFKLSCKPGAMPHPYLGRVVYTQDPGFALTTGQCRDIGKITMQNMRGIASRAPYFANGSAKTLREIVDFYDRRYRIGYTEQEKQDLTNLLSVL